MPKRVSTEELAGITAFIERHPDGIQAGAIRENLGLELTDRTLQRRLTRLEALGKIRSQGTGTGKRYFPITPARTQPEQARPSAGGIKLSDEGQRIREIVAKPVAERTPVGYQPSFLESYEPNRTSYLSQEIQNELIKIGRVEHHELPAGTYLRQVMDRLIIDLSWNSSRLEGNTYSLLDTQLLLEKGVSAEGKAAEETQMILNHKSAIEMLAEQAGGIGFNRYTICNLHALLGENLLPNPAAGGMLRSRLIGIAASVYEPLQVPQQIETYFDLMLGKAEAIANPFEQSFFIMVHLPYLQPFEDVNKRVSRLAANIPMIRHNLCPLSFVDVSEEDYVRGTLGVYELTRIDYLREVYAWAYRRSCARYSPIRQSLGEPDPFRLRHRERIGEYVRGVVQGVMDKRTASAWIAARAKGAIDTSDLTRFQGVVETELNSLHEGNIARYRLRPSEYAAWAKGWA